MKSSKHGRSSRTGLTAWKKRRAWRQIAEDALKKDSSNMVGIAQQAGADVPEVNPLEALRARRRYTRRGAAA